MSKPTLIHRGYLYAQKHVTVASQPLFDGKVTTGSTNASEVRMAHAVTWRAGYLAAQVDRRRRKRARRAKKG